MLFQTNFTVLLRSNDFKFLFYITTGGIERAFNNVGPDVDYVINLASETRSGQSEGVYKDGILQLTSNVAQYVATKYGNRLKLYVEFSTGTLYPKDKVKKTKKQNPISSSTKSVLSFIQQQ